MGQEREKHPEGSQVAKMGSLVLETAQNAWSGEILKKIVFDNCSKEANVLSINRSLKQCSPSSCHAINVLSCIDGANKWFNAMGLSRDALWKPNVFLNWSHTLREWFTTGFVGVRLMPGRAAPKYADKEVCLLSTVFHGNPRWTFRIEMVTPPV